MHLLSLLPHSFPESVPLLAYLPPFPTSPSLLRLGQVDGKSNAFGANHRLSNSPYGIASYTHWRAGAGSRAVGVG